MTAAQAAQDLLRRFNVLTGRAATDVITDTVKYQLLSDAQSDIIMDVARVAPWVLYPHVETANMPQMATTDHNVFTFVDANNTPVEVFGDAQIYQRLSDIPDRPLRPDWDYIGEGNQIRIPRQRQITTPLYWRGIVMPPPITDGGTNPSTAVAPALFPQKANELTAIRAAHDFAEGGNVRNAALADRLDRRFKEKWPEYCVVWKRQFSKGGALRVYTARDLVMPLGQ